MPRKKKIEDVILDGTLSLDEEESTLPKVGGNRSLWPVFQENDVLFSFHFCGETENSMWFRKTEGWDTNKPRCELCKKSVPAKVVGIVKLNASGL